MIALPPPRPYQTELYQRAQQAAARAHLGGTGCGVLVQAPTGAGKTLIALMIARGALDRGGEVLWLAPRTELVDQPVARLWEYGFREVQVIRAGRVTGDPRARLRVASVQTLLARGMRPPARVVILDEARHYVAAEWARVATAYPNAVRVGLDATPVRADGTSLRDLFDVLVPGPSVRELVDGGHLVPCVVYAPAEGQRALAASPLEAYEKYANGTRAVLFAPNVVWSKQWASQFTLAGIAAEHVDGTTPEDVRARALRRLASGDLRVLCNVALFAEGVDVPEVEACIVARGVSSEAAWLQMIGRVLRPSPKTGKVRAVVVDLMGHVHRHGLVDEPRAFSLDGEPIRRLETLPSAVQCKSCLAWGPGGRPCVACGAELPPPKAPRVKAAELIEVRAREPEAKKRAALERFVRREVAAGRSPWRALHVYRGVYGVDPPREWIREAACST